VRQRGNYAPVIIPGPFELWLSFTASSCADVLEALDVVSRLGGRFVGFAGEDVRRPVGRFNALCSLAWVLF
jgi:D-aminopeptidase